MKYVKRALIMIVVLFIIIIVSGILSLYYLNCSAMKLEADIEAASTSLNSINWEGAQKHLDSFEEKWSKTKGYWATLIDHIEIDNIQGSYTKSKKYIEAKEYPSATAELESLKELIQHIPEKERFTLENIF